MCVRVHMCNISAYYAYLKIIPTIPRKQKTWKIYLISRNLGDYCVCLGDLRCDYGNCFVLLNMHLWQI